MGATHRLPRARHERRIAAAAVAASLLLLTPSSALAQETRENELLEQELAELERTTEEKPSLVDFIRVKLTVANRYVPTADFGAFEATSNQPEGRLRIDVPLSRRSLARISVSGRMLLYDFDGAAGQVAGTTGAPFNNLYQWDARLQLGHLLPESWKIFSEHERWAIFGQGGARASWERGSDMSDGVRPFGGLGINFAYGDRFEAALGASVNTDLIDDGVSVGPLFEFSWRFLENWRIRNFGKGLELEHRFGESLRFYLRARLESHSYRLGDRGPGIGAGKVSVKQLPVGLGARWRVSPALDVTTFFGAMLQHRLKIVDENSQTLFQDEAGTTAYLTVRFDLRKR